MFCVQSNPYGGEYFSNSILPSDFTKRTRREKSVLLGTDIGKEMENRAKRKYLKNKYFLSLKQPFQKGTSNT